MDEIDTILAEVLTDNFFGTTDGANAVRIETIKNLILKILEGYQKKESVGETE
ncbi:MAG: hypothetical protein WC389_07990 [Lutibacter sp.]|jgi:hypothetical protein